MGALALLAAAGIAACGGSSNTANAGGSGPAAADPATRVPSSAVFYASASLKPGADTTKSLTDIVDTFGGDGTFQRLLGKLKQQIASQGSGLTYARDVQPWLGRRVGVAFTRWPANFNSNDAVNDIVVVLPTANPAAATKALPDLKNSMSQNHSDTTVAVSGNFVYLGGKPAISAAQAVTSSNSLANSSNYKASLQNVHANPLATAYVKPKSIAPLLTREINNSVQAGNIPSPSTAAIAKAFDMVPANASGLASLSVTSKTIEFDVTESPSQSLSSFNNFTDVGSLPGDSWLAIASPGISEQTVKQGLQSLTQTATSGGQTTAQQAQGIARIIGQLVPHGIGGIAASAAGSFTNDNPPKIGLSLDVKDAQTAQNSTSMLFNFLQAGGANVPGSANAFTLPVSSSVSVNVGSAGSDVVATLGYPNAAAFNSPSSTLADDDTYKQALAQLPSGSKVPLYVNLGELAHDLPASAFSGASGQQAQMDLKKFSYAIAGVNPSDSEVSVVVGLN